ncbi:unnamed protein product [Merluccius merluccius]
MSTKKLAKELGLLRKRSRSAGNKASPVCNQIFSYLIVIDFESTCWKEKNNYGQEIIEFPAVLLNTSTGEIDSEYHTYVQPQEHPVLSDFCTELTGITQRQVEAGVPLHICLSRFSRWLRALQLQKGLAFPGEQPPSAPSVPQKPCAFLTWSDWDLAVCLQYECKRKQLHKPDMLNSWIDLRATYRLFYNRKPKGLNGALQDLGIQFSGREHSGLDDSRNTAQLALRMMRDGCVMKLTRTQERAPMKPKPLFGNAPISKKEKNDDMDQDIKSKSPRRSLHITCSKTNVPLSVTKENGDSIPQPFQEYKSLISPRTLLNGTTTPLLGKGSAAGKRMTMDLFSPVLLNAASRLENSHSLVLCSTTVGRISHRPQVHLTSEPRAAVLLEHTKDDTETDIVVETEESYGCYDYVVLDGDGDDVTTDLYEENGLLDTEDEKSAVPPLSSHPTTSSRSCQSTTRHASLLHPSRPGTPRITAPLCGCGRRAKRQTVCNGGPNHGRGFYCCPVRRSGTGGNNMGQNGCKFFKWESALIQDSSPGNSWVQPGTSLRGLGRPQLSSTSRKSY